MSFCAYSYVGSRYICILPPTSPFPSNQSIDMILWTSGPALGGDDCAFQKQGDSIQDVTAWQGLPPKPPHRSRRTAVRAPVAVRQLHSGSPAAQLRAYSRSAPGVEPLSSGRTAPFSSVSRFNLDFRESKPKFLSPNSSRPLLRLR